MKTFTVRPVETLKTTAAFYGGDPTLCPIGPIPA
jgi:hypothetical protein